MYICLFSWCCVYRGYFWSAVYALWLHAVTVCAVLAVVTVLIVRVQIDNQLPISLHPHLLHPIPPPPSVGTYGETNLPACTYTCVVHSSLQSCTKCMYCIRICLYLYVEAYLIPNLRTCVTDCHTIDCK